jgi:alpha-1,6-mannosyltransferase
MLTSHQPNLRALKPYLCALAYGTCLLLTLLIASVSYYLSAIHSSPINSNDAPPNAHFGTYVLLQFSVMAVVMLVAWRFAPAKNSRHFIRNLLAIGILARLMLIGVEPYTSNDVDRYLFDGRVALAGLDPYSISHNDSSLTALRTEWQPPSEHAQYPTIYPPLAIALFSLSATAGAEHAQTLWRTLVTLASILVLVLSALMLKNADKIQYLPLIALSPLLILEAGVGLHVDIFSALAIVGAILSWQHKRLFLCGLLIGIGALLKMLPIMLLLPLFFIQPNLKRALTLACGAIAIILLGYGLAFSLGFRPVGSLGVFFEKWRFASPLFTFFENQLNTNTLFIISISLAAIACALIALASYRNKKAINQTIIIYCLQFSVALPLILSPVVFPWYLMPLVPLLALQPNRYLLGWTLLMPLTYEVLNQFRCCQLWVPALWPVILLVLLYSITILMLIIHFCKSKFAKQIAV